MNVDVNMLTFTHHDLMSREHVLASRLSTLANQYQERKQANVVDYHTEKVQKLFFLQTCIYIHVRLNVCTQNLFSMRGETLVCRMH